LFAQPKWFRDNNQRILYFKPIFNHCKIDNYLL
jgi:hypothetical protein